jgi:hypothetical protein
MLSLVGVPEIPGLGGLGDLTGGLVPGMAPKEPEPNGDVPTIALSPEEQEKQDLVNKVDDAVNEVNIFFSNP